MAIVDIVTGGKEDSGKVTQSVPLLLRTRVLLFLLLLLLLFLLLGMPRNVRPVSLNIPCMHLVRWVLMDLED